MSIRRESSDHHLDLVLLEIEISSIQMTIEECPPILSRKMHPITLLFRFQEREIKVDK